MDKKMRDNDIKKALECCSKGKSNCYGECPRSDNNSLSISACRFELLGDVLDLLNRKDAEIERLKKEATEQQLRKEMHRLTVDEVKSEAIKEFAEQVKKYRCVMGCGYDVVDVVNKLVKEMTEQNDFKE